jgi:hypothetical protein
MSLEAYEPDFARTRKRPKPVTKGQGLKVRHDTAERCPKEHPAWHLYWTWTKLPIRVEQQRCHECDKGD